MLRGHNKAVRRALEEHGGREVKYTVDGIMASFPSVVAARQAALVLQRELASGEVRVRVGLNAGGPIAEDTTCSAPRCSWSLASSTTQSLVRCWSRAWSRTCARQGLHAPVEEATLKGFDEPVALFEVRLGQRNARWWVPAAMKLQHATAFAGDPPALKPDAYPRPHAFQLRAHGAATGFRIGDIRGPHSLDRYRGAVAFIRRRVTQARRVTVRSIARLPRPSS